MGKSGLIARKVAATLSSTGTPALFMHPVEALHGDLGMVSDGDVVLAEYTQPFNENDITYFFPLYIRAVAILERIATPEARRLLDQLANGGLGVPLTEEATSALQRLSTTAIKTAP